MKTPLFTVIIPTLNEEKFLPKLLASLAAQTTRDFEVIVVDGSSTDATVKLAKTFAKKLPKLTVIVSKKASLPLQRNLGAKAAKGEWLAFIDADSVFLPYCIERIEVFIEHSKSKFFISWCRSDSEVTKDALQALIANAMWESAIILKRPIAPGPFSFVHRSVFDAIGGYDEKATFGEDFDFTLRAFNKGVQLSVLRETLWVWSQRRMRKQGGFKMFMQYTIGGLNGLFFNKALKNMAGYTMGGHVYTKKEDQSKLQKLLKELFQ